ncbi:MAG: aminopeptidase, partial [Bdellovibrionales bacterium]|nr:aminopeptidase [Bdellovibrionales bacterium]
GTLLVRYGLNVQSDQYVTLAGEVGHRELLRILVEKCYRSGARYVSVEIHDPHFLRSRIEHSHQDHLSYVPHWETAETEELVELKGATLGLVGPEEPKVLEGLDPQKLNAVRVARYNSRKRFYQDGIDRGLVQWCVAAAPTERWAELVFPECSPEEALRSLWNELFAICRCDRSDFLDAWRSHRDVLMKRAQHLTSLKLQTLRFVGPGTDLSVGLSSHAKFLGGAEVSSSGVVFDANIPTEECFTTPDWRKTEGKVVVTRPVLVNGTLVEGLKLEFREGQIVHFQANHGSDVFEALLSSDDGAKRLGEVALVGVDSPIFRTGRIFQEILLDENAACHIAIGSAYRTCLKAPENQSEEAFFTSVGCNESSVHTDLMISSEAVDVVGIDSTGKVIPLLRQGQWV